MPELPDVTVYLECLERLTLGKSLRGLRIRSPFLLRSVDPPVSALVGTKIVGFRRLGKRLVFAMEHQRFIVLHLMIAGRLRRVEAGAPLRPKLDQAAFDFDEFSIRLTEAGTKKRASLYLVQGEAGLAVFDRGGVEPLTATFASFRAALQRENRTLKRALTDPTLFSGIGNAYSDEILHSARLSPVKRTRSLEAGEIKRLRAATQKTLKAWTERLRREVVDGFPEKVTAFRDGMAVHGRYKQPCPVCGKPVQRIRHAQNEVNYCAVCQTEGKLLADRALSRLLKTDWPRSLEELEERLSQQAAPTTPAGVPAKPGARKRG